MDRRGKAEYLEQYQSYGRRLSRANLEAEQWKSLAELPDCPEAGQELERLRAEVRSMAADRECIERAISHVQGSKLREIMELRYLSGMTWKDVAEATYTDERWVRRLHDRAMDKINLEF